MRHRCVSRLHSAAAAWVVTGALIACSKRHKFAMNQDLAKKLFSEGAFLILLDVPQGTEFGMDWNSWITGPKFKGVKMIPPGFHFIFYSSNSKHGGHSSPRTGFFHFFNQREILVSKWDPQMEEVNMLDMSEEELNAIKQDLRNLDKNLAPYPFETLQKWVSLTDQITQEVLTKLQPESGKILSVPELVSDTEESALENMSDPRKSRHGKVDEDGLPVLKARPGTEINFTKVPKVWYPPGATPTEVSKHSVDSSYILRQMIENCTKPEDLLGELQFAFVCFVLGQVLDAFEQWKSLVLVLCSCDELMASHQTFFQTLISLFYHQINEIPQDFFVDVVSSNNFLVSTLSVLFCTLESDGMDEGLKKRAKQFRKYLTKKFKWDFKSEPEDWAPVVVET